MKPGSVLPVALCLCWLSMQVFAAAATAVTPETRSPESWRHLEILVETIESMRAELRELRIELRAADSEREQVRLTREIEQRSLDLESLQTALELLATESVDLGLFGVRTETAFDWREELQSVFEPILLEMRRLTERPRKLERLRGEQAYYQERVEAAETALRNIARNRENAPSPQLRDAFAALEQRWQRRHQEVSNRLSLIELELQQTLTPPATQQQPLERLRILMSGRVLNLVIAILVMLFVYLAMRALARVYDRQVMRRARERGVFAARVGNLLFYLFTTIMVLLSGMAVFYIRGDWLLLGLLLILLAGAALAAQRSLPRFLTEARLMLNLGPVREGERIIFDGLPWRVRTLGMYATLENPLLQGGVLTLPLRMLVEQRSRRYDPDEPWFPARVGDWLLLGDGTFGKVAAQTPEHVQLTVLGSLKTYPARDFIGLTPRNLSEGFIIVVEFGLDYRHQDGITTLVREQMARDVAEGLAASDVAEQLTQFSVEFAKAGESSLNLALIAGFKGAAADRYFRIQRLIQRLAVEACNRHGWVIPFNQLTVHMTRGTDAD
jgi:hypothetical protein